MSYIYNKNKTENFRRELRKNMTEEEAILWVQLKGKKHGVRFRRQHSVGEYIADFYCPEKKLVIELDGSQHLENVAYDEKREAYMKSWGIKTLRFWNQDIRNNLDGVMIKILSEIQ